MSKPDLPAWTFGRCGPVLEANGFQLLPISRPYRSDPNLGKRPPETLAAWSQPAAAATRLPRYAGCGTGILTATTPAADIDVRHAELADVLDHMVVKLAGEAPVRFGQAPKRLRVYRTADPFGKMSTAGYTLPGDRPGNKPHKVEILAAGQQFVAYGVHPVTGLPYSWPDDDPLDLERGLPELPAGLTLRIRDAAETILAKAGTVATCGITRSSGPRRPGPAPRQVRNLAEARRVLDVLRNSSPSRLDHDAWIRVGYGLKAALGGLHLIRLKIAGNSLPEVTAAPGGITRTERRRLHAKRRLRYVRSGRGVPCLVIAVPLAAGAFS